MKKTVIDLRGPKGNAYFLLAFARRLCGVLGKDRRDVLKRMQCGDYEHLVRVFEEEFGEFVEFKGKEEVFS